MKPKQGKRVVYVAGAILVAVLVGFLLKWWTRRGGDRAMRSGTALEPIVTRAIPLGAMRRTRPEIGRLTSRGRKRTVAFYGKKQRYTVFAEEFFLERFDHDC